MLDLADMEELLANRLPAAHPAGSEFASFENFCDTVERIMGVASLDDSILSDAFDSWAADVSPEAFAARYR